MLYVISVYIVWNVIVMLIYGLDKLKAKHSKRRIPESSLLILALLLGGFGAWGGMYLFRHKTKHKKFVILVPICAIINLFFIYLIRDSLLLLM